MHEDKHKMILVIFSFLVLFSFVLVGMGYFMAMDALSITGFSILFLLGFVFLTNNLEVQNGSTVITNGSTSVITPNYVTYSNHTIAFLMTIIAAVGFIFILVDRRKEKVSY